MQAYDTYLFLHVAAATVWIGAAFLMLLFTGRVGVARDEARTIAYAGDAEWLGLRLYLPTNALALVSGILLVKDGPWDYGQLWIQLGLGGFALSFLTGALVFGPQWPRVRRLAEVDGLGAPTTQRRLRLLVVVSGFDVGLLLGIVFAMTVKPTAASGGAFFVTAALPVVGVALGGALSSMHATGGDAGTVRGPPEHEGA